MKRALVMLAGLAVLSSSSARAEIPPILRPGTHPWFGSLSLGVAGKLKDTPTQFKLVEAVGYHFSGNAGGPAIVFELQESLSDEAGSTAYVVEIGPKFQWDIPIVQNLGLYLTPSVMLGYSRAGWSGNNVFGFGGVPSSNGFTLQFGFEGRLILADRGLVFMRPFTIDVGGGQADCNGCGFNTGVRWDFLMGGGVIF
jgi:hypothetical protein